LTSTPTCPTSRSSPIWRGPSSSGRSSS
jgi:hypothetical protein